MKTIKQTLKGAIGTGELINIIYSAGSEPGTSRMIMPFKIKGDKIMAKCYTTNTVKTYFFEKMTLANSDKTTYLGNQKRPKPSLKAAKPVKSGGKIDINKFSIFLKIIGIFIGFVIDKRSDSFKT